MRPFRGLTTAISALTFFPAIAHAEATQTAQSTGVSAIWLLANFSFAGMRAQNSPSSGWRVISFIFGFPGTLLSWFLVEEGAGRAYGVELPHRLP